MTTEPAPRVRVRLPDGSAVDLVPGNIVGRGPGSTLVLPDPGVSEAHALVSLRDGELRLIALRGALLVEGQRVSEVVLRPGVVARLTDRAQLEVVEVSAPGAASPLQTPPTEHRGRVWPPLRVVVDFESTVVTAEGGAELRVLGVPATLLFHLVDFGVPTPWAALAHATWRREADEQKLRWRFDKVLKQLRTDLAAAGLRPDLVGHRGGEYFLHLLPDDALVNATAAD